jgi:UDPglucose 6-dehydrogenase
MKEIKIGIVGFGILGKALKHVFDIKFPVYVYDKYQKEYLDITPVSKEADIIFLAIPTPMRDDGKIDLECVEDALKTISEAVKKEGRTPIIVLRSTIIPGTTEILQKKYPQTNLVFNPEFLTEKNFLNDMRNTSKIVIGSSNKESAEIVQQVYKEIFPDAKYILTDTKTAEMIKYASNVTLSSQIMIANELYQICQKLGIDYETIRKTLLLDRRIGTNINVPGTDGDFGFGGKCFPKDLNALISFSRERGYNPELLEQVWKTNIKLRKNHDWESIKGATSKNGFKSII